MATDYAEQALVIAKDTGRTVDDTVAQIKTLCEAAVQVSGPLTDSEGDTPGLESFLWTFWTGFVDAMQNDMTLHARGITILAQVKALPGPSNWRVWYEAATWAKLPLFGPVARESFNGPVPGSRTASQEWLALNTFLARLLASGVWDSAMFALWALRDALEYPPTSDHYVHGPVTRELALEVGAAWIIQAAAQIFKRRDIWGPNGLPEWPENAGAPGRGGELWTGIDGYHPERWNLWKQGFESVIADQKQPQRLRSLCKEAVEAMVNAEAQSA